MTQPVYPQHYPVAGPARPAPPAPKPKHFGWPMLIIAAVGSWFIGLIMGMILVAAMLPPSTANTTSAETLPEVSTSTAPTTAPSTEPSAKITTQAPEPTKKTMTRSQEQALGSAEDYLDYSAFSRKGLIRQLSSDAGEGYPKADAVWAVDHVKVNWNDQAYKSAKDYLDYSHFSRSGLIQQLESDSGEGFTHSQAVYGAEKALAE